MSGQWKLQICLVAMVAVVAALSLAFPDERVAYAQGEDGDYVDVGLTLEVPNEGTALTHDLRIIVVNQGSKTAYDVEVVVDIVYPRDSSHFHHVPRLPVGSVSLENNKRLLRWSIPSLRGLRREAVTVRVANRDAQDLFDYRKYPHEHFGRVTTSSFESELHQGNNISRVWSFKTSSLDDYHQAAGQYSVAVSMNEPFPSPGDTVEFTIETVREKSYPETSFLHPPPIDLKVDIELTDGLTVTGMPSYVSKTASDVVKTKPDSMRYSSGVFNVGTLKSGDGTKNSVTLPVTVGSNAAGTQQCLTAKLTGNPPPGIGPYDDDISDNVAKV